MNKPSETPGRKHGLRFGSCANDAPGLVTEHPLISRDDRMTRPRVVRVCAKEPEDSIRRECQECLGYSVGLCHLLHARMHTHTHTLSDHGQQRKRLATKWNASWQRLTMRTAQRSGKMATTDPIIHSQSGIQVAIEPICVSLHAH